MQIYFSSRPLIVSHRCNSTRIFVSLQMLIESREYSPSVHDNFQSSFHPLQSTETSMNFSERTSSTPFDSNEHRRFTSAGREMSRKKKKKLNERIKHRLTVFQANTSYLRSSFRLDTVDPRGTRVSFRFRATLYSFRICCRFRFYFDSWLKPCRIIGRFANSRNEKC